MTIPVLTKNVIITVLKDQLEKNGVETTAFEIITTPGGKKDIYIGCKHDIYVYDIKFTEKNLLKAMNKIYNDYFRYDKSEIKGGFAIVCPPELSDMPVEIVKKNLNTLTFTGVILYPPGDTTRRVSISHGTLVELAHDFYNYITSEYVEPDIQWIVKILRKAADYIAQGLNNLDYNQLKDICGGSHVFKNILHYEENYPVEKLRLGCAYLLLNQIVFYHILSQRTTLSEINPDTLQVPSQLVEYFCSVNKHYSVIFSYDIASKFSKKYIDTIKIVINVIKCIGIEKIDSDVLGTVFHDIIPFNIRKHVAAFYTNVYAADVLTWLSIKEYDVTVSDFAAGSGGLLVSAYERKKYLLEQIKKFSQKDHKKFIDQLCGIDVMPFAASVAVCHLAVKSPDKNPHPVNVAVWDSTELEPGVCIPSIAGSKNTITGHLRLEKEVKKKEKNENKNCSQNISKKVLHKIILGKADIVIMNPPFTRQERMPDRYKKKLALQFKEYEQYLHGQLGYYGYYILLADKFLDTGGKLAFVLPAAFLRVHSAEGIRKLLCERYTIDFIITGRHTLNFSESTWRREILLIATKSLEKKDTIFAGIEKLPENKNELEKICKKIEGVTGICSDNEMSAFCVSQKELQENLDWFRFIAPFESSHTSAIWKSIKKGNKLEKFGAVYGLKKIMRRGIETAKGMKVQIVFIPYTTERAIRKDDTWIVNSVKEVNTKEKVIVYNRFSNNTIEVPKKCVIPCLRTISNNTYMEISKTDFVVIKDFENAHTFFYNERAKYRNVLPKWERYVKNRMGNVIILRRFVINAPGTLHLCYYAQPPIAPPGTAWVLNLDDDEAKIICLWFNSSINLAQIFFKRIEDVWVDIHKYILHDFYVINPEALSNKEKEKLLHLFELYRKKEMPSLADQYLSDCQWKRDLDATILSILGFDNTQIENILQELYHALQTQFETLQKME